MRIVFKHADVLVHTGATRNQLDYWLQLGLIIPAKTAASSGDHREFSVLNVVEVARAVWLTAIGMSTDRINQIFALERLALARIPAQHRAVQAWTHYVEMVRAGARLMGLTGHTAFVEWERDVTGVLRRFEKKAVATDSER